MESWELFLNVDFIVLGILESSILLLYPNSAIHKGDFIAGFILLL